MDEYTDFELPIVEDQLTDKEFFEVAKSAELGITIENYILWCNRIITVDLIVMCPARLISQKALDIALPVVLVHHNYVKIQFKMVIWWGL